jgi:asparagine synthase (glutamine-hydrolysing)
MCGIAGRVSLTASPSTTDLEMMIATLCHRGPDDWGLWQSPGGQAGLAHRRLAIVDLSELGRNPMLWDDGRLTITFNGEIYNYRDLRQQLERDGYRFRSQTDTEVILAAYDRWGIECLAQFAGMFAFALWDEPRRRLFLARDRVGKKPLYYSERNGSVQFASELKALLADPGMPRTVNRTALQLYLRYGYVPAPFSIFESAKKLPPAHYMLVEGGRVSVARYWDPAAFATVDDAITEADARAEFEHLIGQAVAQRRIADVPLGAFLSGGIDSSLVVALMAEQSSAPVQTHTIRFADPEYNEADHAAAIAKHLGTDHHETLCDEQQMLAVVDRVPAMFDEPFADSSAIPTFLVSAAARRGVTVALSGDGGDEVFLGYPRYTYFEHSLWMLYVPRPLRRLGAALARRAPQRRVRRAADVLEADGLDPYSRFVTWFNPSLIREVAGSDAAQAPLYREMLGRVRGLPRPAQAGLLDMVSYLPDDILVKVDRASMATSLEVRAPLLDHRVVERALQMPLAFKYSRGETKRLLRQLLYKRVPRPLVDRPKMGFSVPLRAWFDGPLRTRMDEYCEGSAFDALGLDPAPIRQMWHEFKAGAPLRADLIWQAYILAAWSHSFVECASSHRA